MEEQGIMALSKEDDRKYAYVVLVGFINKQGRTGSGCSKLTTSLVNVSLKFQT